MWHKGAATSVPNFTPTKHLLVQARGLPGSPPEKVPILLFERPTLRCKCAAKLYKPTEILDGTREANNDDGDWFQIEVSEDEWAAVTHSDQKAPVQMVVVSPNINDRKHRVRASSDMKAKEVGMLDVSQVVTVLETIVVDDNVRVRIGENRWVTQCDAKGFCFLQQAITDSDTASGTTDSKKAKKGKRKKASGTTDSKTAWVRLPNTGTKISASNKAKRGLVGLRVSSSKFKEQVSLVRVSDDDAVTTQQGSFESAEQRRWKAGDVIGCSLQLNVEDMQATFEFHCNGRRLPISVNTEIARGDTFFPAVSFVGGPLHKPCATLLVTAAELTHDIPDGFTTLTCGSIVASSTKHVRVLHANHAPDPRHPERAEVKTLASDADIGDQVEASLPSGRRVLVLVPEEAGPTGSEQRQTFQDKTAAKGQSDLSVAMPGAECSANHKKWYQSQDAADHTAIYTRLEPNLVAKAFEYKCRVGAKLDVVSEIHNQDGDWLWLSLDSDPENTGKDEDARGNGHTESTKQITSEEIQNPLNESGNNLPGTENENDEDDKGGDGLDAVTAVATEQLAEPIPELDSKPEPERKASGWVLLRCNAGKHAQVNIQRVCDKSRELVVCQLMGNSMPLKAVPSTNGHTLHTLIAGSLLELLDENIVQKAVHTPIDKIVYPRNLSYQFDCDVVYFSLRSKCMGKGSC